MLSKLVNLSMPQFPHLQNAERIGPTQQACVTNQIRKYTRLARMSLRVYHGGSITEPEPLQLMWKRVLLQGLKPT